MDADRRRLIARELLDAIDAIPADIAGPGGFDVTDLIATTKLEEELIGQLTDEMERGHRIAKALDDALVLLNGGWRFITLAERRGDEAEYLYRAFHHPAVTDK